jgi:signal peptidase I
VTTPSVAKKRTMKSLVLLWLVTLILSLFGWFAAFVTVPLAFGWRSAVVISDSMLPRIHPGDVVLMPQNDHRLAVGQVVTFRSADHPGETITHRLEAHNANGTWTTHGDFNATPDTTALRENQIVGKPSLLVPYAGILTYWRHSGQNNKLFGVLASALALFATMAALLNRDAPSADADTGSGEAPVRPNKPRVPRILKPIATIAAASLLIPLAEEPPVTYAQVGTGWTPAQAALKPAGTWSIRQNGLHGPVSAITYTPAGSARPRPQPVGWPQLAGFLGPIALEGH